MTHTTVTDCLFVTVAGVAAAADAGYARLGESALDAVEAAVRSLESDPAFNAGRGASLNQAGEVELDSVIMDGRTLDAGAVAAIGPVAHPVSVARLLMQHTEHVLLVGSGATAFAREMGVPILEASELVTAESHAEWQAMATFGQSVTTLYNSRNAPPVSHGHDTVGAVALDAEGNLAAATSTGGITYKRVGRVGDSPLIGSGCLADNHLGAISTTGHGEAILKYTLASRVLHRLSLASASAGEGEAARALAGELEAMYARLDGSSGGAVCLSPTGDLGVAFTSSRMAWATRSEAGAEAVCGIEREQQGAGGALGVAEVVPYTRIYV